MGGLTRAEQRGRIPSFNLLAMLPGMQPRVRLAFLLVMSSFSSPSTPQVILGRDSLHPFFTQPVLTTGVDSYGAGPCTWPC